MSHFDDTPDSYPITPAMRHQLIKLDVTFDHLVGLGLRAAEHRLRQRRGRPKRDSRDPMVELEALEIDNVE